MGFLFLEGGEVVWLGLFDKESAKEVVFRLKLLLQNLHTTRATFEAETVRTLTPEQVENYRCLWERFRVEVFVSPEVDKARIQARGRELTADLTTVPWTLLTEDEVQAAISREYDSIGEI